jgi:hypothetical protein
LSNIEGLCQQLIDIRTNLDQELNKFVKEIDRIIKNRQNEVSSLIQKIANRLVVKETSAPNINLLREAFGNQIQNYPTLADIDKLKSYMPGGKNDLLNALPLELNAFEINLQSEFLSLKKILNLDRMDTNINTQLTELFAVGSAVVSAFQTIDEAKAAL